MEWLSRPLLLGLVIPQKLVILALEPEIIRRLVGFIGLWVNFPKFVGAKFNYLIPLLSLRSWLW